MGPKNNQQLGKREGREDEEVEQGWTTVAGRGGRGRGRGVGEGGGIGSGRGGRGRRLRGGGEGGASQRTQGPEIRASPASLLTFRCILSARDKSRVGWQMCAGPAAHLRASLALLERQADGYSPPKGDMRSGAGGSAPRRR